MSSSTTNTARILFKRHFENSIAFPVVRAHEKQIRDNLVSLKKERENINQQNIETAVDDPLLNKQLQDIRASIHEALFQSTTLDIKIISEIEPIQVEDGFCYRIAIIIKNPQLEKHYELPFNEKSIRAILRNFTNIFQDPTFVLKRLSFTLSMDYSGEIDLESAELRELTRNAIVILNNCTDEFQRMALALYQNNALKTLELNLSHQHANSFTKLFTDTRISSLILQSDQASFLNNTIAVKNHTLALVELAEALLTNSSLLTLNLPVAAKFQCHDALTKILTTNQTLISLNLDQNPYDSNLLIDDIAEFCTEGLTVSQKNIQEIGSTLLASTNTTLREISLNGYYFSQVNLELFLNILRTNRILTSMAISHHQRVPQTQLVAFANALLGNPVIKTFIFEPAYPDEQCVTGEWDSTYKDWSLNEKESNEEEASAVQAFSKVLRENKTLACLKTGIWKHQDPLILANAWMLSHSLFTLSLPLLCINQETATALLQRTRRNTNLTDLNFYMKYDHDVEDCKKEKGDLDLPYLKDTLQPEIDQIMARNIALRANWSRIAILTTFVRSNSSNALRNCVLPLINTILDAAEIQENLQSTSSTATACASQCF